MALLTRRTLVAAGVTVLGAALVGKYAAEWRDSGRLVVRDAGEPAVGLRQLSDIVPARAPGVLPAVAFATLAGGRSSLSDYAGKRVVLNFWATWCHPCVAELPELDRLAAAGEFTVLAVSADRGGAAVVGPFAAAHHLDHATVLLDPGSAAVQALGIGGFPTTLLVGADGRLRGTLEGPAAWGEAGGVLRNLLGEGKAFFFEKKKHKTFIRWVRDGTEKVFGPFVQKRTACCLVRRGRTAARSPRG